MTFKKGIFVISSLLFLLITTACSASSEKSDINMNDGNWEITTKMEMANLPFAMPPMTYTSCVTKESLIPAQDNKTQQDKCEVTQQQVRGDTVSWTVVCDTDAGKNTSTGTITYKGDTFEGEMTVQAPGVGEMHQTMTGRRIGPCK